MIETLKTFFLTLLNSWKDEEKHIMRIKKPKKTQSTETEVIIQKINRGVQTSPIHEKIEPKHEQFKPKSAIQTQEIIKKINREVQTNPVHEQTPIKTKSEQIKPKSLIQIHTQVKQEKTEKCHPKPSVSQRPLVQEPSKKKRILDIPFIKPRETMNSLAKEYNNENFKKNINQLRKKGIFWIVRTRGDGNCFYRAFVFHFFRWLLKHKRDGTASFSIFKEFDLIQNVGQILKLNDEKKYKELEYQLSNCNHALKSFDEIENEQDYFNWMNNEIYSNSMVYLMRLIAAHELVFNEDYKYFIPSDYKNIFEYVLKNAIAMGEEAGELEIKAIGDSLSKNAILDPFLLDGFYPELRIFYLDGNERELREYIYSLYTPKTSDMKPESLKLLFRPGHYDVLM